MTARRAVGAHHLEYTPLGFQLGVRRVEAQACILYLISD